MFISPALQIHEVPESSGADEALDLLAQEEWLMDTEVRYCIQSRNSAWHLMMVFVDLRNAMRFITRKIDVYYSERKALTYAKILQRGIRKDARGTLKSEWNAFRICSN
ncbi:MAG: hypothetical protein HRU12_19275 [Phaeodactylibacter sp.]|nr:hypothetical protein [Phaeodactylibacter sp.]